MVNPSLDREHSGPVYRLRVLGMVDEGFSIPSAAQPWMDRAACREVGPAPFYAEEPSPTGRYSTARVAAERDAQEAQAKRVCRRCPVRAECLAYAIANDERYGVWGGKTEVERNGVRGA